MQVPPLGHLKEWTDPPPGTPLPGARCDPPPGLPRREHFLGFPVGPGQEGPFRRRLVPSDHGLSLAPQDICGGAGPRPTRPWGRRARKGRPPLPLAKQKGPRRRPSGLAGIVPLGGLHPRPAGRPASCSLAPRLPLPGRRQPGPPPRRPGLALFRRGGSGLCAVPLPAARPPARMDPPAKAGLLLLQQPSGLRIGAKRWKKGWFVLYPASPHGVARLEFFDGKEGAAASDRVGTKRLDKKIVRLADCVSVAPVPDCVPKEGLAAFRLETSERTYLFAAEPQETAEWMAKLCEAAFLGNPGKGAPLATEPGGQHPLEMATNSIYSSRDEASEFWVTVQKTEAAERCKLQGAFVLKASWDGLVLQDPHSRQPLYTWPYRLLRRYGRDKVMFSFEAGRRCASGPGNFTFETKQGNEVFRVVEAAIQEQKAQAEENRQSGSSLDSGETSGVAHLQSALANMLLLESEGPPERRGPRSAALGTTLSLATEEKEGAMSPRKGQSLRDPLPQWPSTPPRSPLPSEDTVNVYSEPLDAVKGPRLKPDSLYADPLDSRHEGGGWPEEAELGRTGPLYEQVRPVPGGHIYDEPEGRAPRPAPPATPIYDEAHLPCEAWRTQGLEHTAGYELPYRPGAGDYAVPAFHPSLGLKPSRPSPAPKPPRMHKKPSPMLDRAPQKNGSSSCSSNNNNNHHPPPEDAEEGEPIYSRVLRPSTACPGPARREQSVDESRPASVYEDLGEI